MSKVKTANDSPALYDKSQCYPYGVRVPKTIKMLQLVYSFPHIFKPARWAGKGRMYDVWVNRNGAVSAILPEGLLGLKPHEFEVVGWHEVKK